MKKLKQILAMTGAILLFLMYASTLILAFIGSPESINLLKAAVACTFFIPVMIYTIGLVYRVSRDSSDENTEE